MNYDFEIEFNCFTSHAAYSRFEEWLFDRFGFLKYCIVETETCKHCINEWKDILRCLNGNTREGGGKLLPIHSLKLNRNDVFTTCKGISVKIVSR